MLKVNEIFYSIQGESTYTGKPCVFVRLTYCNLRCSYCDTTYAFEDGIFLSIDEILTRVKSYHCRLVEITGGEPLLQSDVYPLMNRLCDEGYEVLIETNGSIDISNIDPRVKRIIDIKCPSSNMMDKIFWGNLQHLKNGDEIKFVISDQIDYEWMKEIINRYRLNESVSVLVSPVFGILSPASLAEWILRDNLNVRMQLQLHKYIWDPKIKGV